MRRGRLASRCIGFVPVRILPGGLPFPSVFHLELKELRENSAGQRRVGEEGTRGSETALLDRKMVWFADECGRSESHFHSDMQSHLFFLCDIVTFRNFKHVS